MKKTLFILLALLMVGSGFAQKAPQTKLISSTENRIVVNFQLNGYNTSKVITPQGEQFIVSAPKMTSMLKAGAPDLPMFSIPAIIGDLAEMTVNVIDAQYTDYANMEIAPSKGNFSRQVNPDDVPYTYGEMYQQNAFWPASQAYLEKPYILRDFRGQNIMVRPFAYNPVSKTLRVYENLTIEMTKVSDNGENQKASRKDNTVKVDPEFRASYDRHFINFGSSEAKYTFIPDAGTMLVVAADQYAADMQPLVEWKNISGRPCSLVTISEIGSNSDTQIKNYIQNLYDTDNLEFILLVGDLADVTSHSMNGGYSDNWYGMLEGTDNYCEAFVGRFSCNSVTDVQTQVNKVLYYERDMPEGLTWVNHGIGIGANEGTGSGHMGGEADYVHMNYIRDTLLHYTYEVVTQQYSGVGSGTSAAAISADVNAGASIINYCNHGSQTSWAVGNYSNSHVNALTNDYMLPYIISVACNNGQFDGTCFGEAWLRATNNSTGAPTGALGGMFSWISQPWTPPMTGQDEMVDIFTEWISSDQFHHTTGGMAENGNMKILDVHPDNDGVKTHNTWIHFGDPSVIMRSDNPVAMDVTVTPAVPMISMSSLSISADTDFGIVTLSDEEGEVLASTYIVDGAAELNFVPFDNVGTFTLVIMGYNKVTYIENIEVVPAEGAYVTVDSYELSNPANYGETVDMDLEIKNVGVETANNIVVTISTENEYINITSDEGSLTSLEADSTAMIEGFQFEVATNVPDGTKAQVDVNITDGTSVWTGKVMIVLHAPIIALQQLNISDTIVEFTFANNGSAPFYGGNLLLSSCSPDLTFDPESFVSEEIVEGGASLSFSATYGFGPDVEPATVFEASYEFTSGDFHVFDIFEVSNGVFSEDFESGVFGENWTFSHNNAWTIVNGGTKGTKCAKSMNNGMSNSDYSMTLTVDVLAAGNVTFMYKVSSEANYDKLHFYLDNQEKGTWSGNGSWEQFSQPVTVGQHTLKWSYTKDSSVNSYDDCGYIDDIVFPPSNSFVFLAPATDLQAEVDGANVTLSWTGSEDAEYYLVKRDGEIITTVTETSCEDVLPKDGTYTYAVYAAVEGGQLSVPVTTTVTAMFDEVVENMNANINVYPNPANDVLNIVIDANNFKYQLVNSLGQVVREGNASNKTVIKTSDLNKGIYFLQISTGAKVMVEKVVVE